MKAYSTAQNKIIMTTRKCDSCFRDIPVDEILHCEDCGACYCARCAQRLGLCEGAGGLTYFD